MCAVAPHHLPLRHFVHSVDVVRALHAAGVSLMHRVQAQVARPALRIGLGALADGHLRSPGVCVDRRPVLIDTPAFAAAGTSAPPTVGPVAGSAGQRSREIRAAESFAWLDRSAFREPRRPRPAVRYRRRCSVAETSAFHRPAVSLPGPADRCESGARFAPGSAPSSWPRNASPAPWPDAQAARSSAGARCAPPIRTTPPCLGPESALLRWLPEKPGFAPGSISLRLPC